VFSAGPHDATLEVLFRSGGSCWVLPQALSRGLMKQASQSVARVEAG
jgi:hypothetical protein